MTSRRPLLALALALLLALPASARAQGTLRTVGNDVAHGVGDIVNVWASPFHADARDWAGFGAVAATFGLLTIVDDNVDHWVVTHPRSGFVLAVKPAGELGGDIIHNPRTRWVDFGTGRRLIPVSGALYLAGLVSGSESLRDAGMGCIASHQTVSIVRGATYLALGRERPKTAGGDQYKFSLHADSWDEESFLAGHPAGAMACASFWSSRFHLGVAEPVLYALAAGVALARIPDRRHWASDVFLGSAFGIASGRAIAIRQKNRRSLEHSASGGASGGTSGGTSGGLANGLYLSRGEDGGLVVGWQRKF